MSSASFDPGVTVVIPTIPTRAKKLAQAVRSVERQTLPAAEIIVEMDHSREGAGPTRTRGLQKVTTEWTAFLDDDDLLLPHHLETLMQLQEESGASICWSWFEGNEVWAHECPSMCPDRCHRHRDFDFEDPHLFGITYMVRTELAQQCEFPPPDTNPEATCGNEDMEFLKQLSKITEPSDWAHIDVVTWRYRVHGENTSGKPENW